MNNQEINNIIQEIRGEQHVPFFISDKVIENILKEGIYDINYVVGKKIDYIKDLQARSLLKKYYLYSSKFKLAEFNELYAGEYATLQAKYNADSCL